MTHEEFRKFFQDASHEEIWKFSSMLREEYEKRKTDGT